MLGITLQDLRDIRSGIKKGERDRRNIERFEADHDAHHARDENWNCGEAMHALVSTFGSDLENEFEVAGYRKVVKAYQHKVNEERATNPNLIAVETTGIENDEQLAAAIARAISDAMKFDSIVSETEDPTEQKGGK